MNLYVQTLRIFMPDGSTFEFVDKKTEPTPTGVSVKSYEQRSAISSDNLIIRNSKENINAFSEKTLAIFQYI